MNKPTITARAASVALFLAFIMIAPAANAQSYYSQPQGFFWPYGTGIGAPREVLTVHAWGPTSAPSYHSMSGAPSPWQTMYPQQNYQYPQYPSYAPTYQQPNYAPQYIPQFSFVPQQYQNFTPQLSYGYQQQYVQPYSQQNYYGGYGGYGMPDGGTDIWGNPSCNWGDYRGYGCDRDPHQWIYDPYSGEYY